MAPGVITAHGFLGAQLAAKLMMPLARANDTMLTLATAVPTGKPDAFVEHGHKMLSEIDETGFEGIPTEKVVLRGNTVAGALAKASKEYDLVVIGASREPLMRKMLVGQIPAKVARFSPASVMLVKRYEGPLKGWFKRTFG